MNGHLSDEATARLLAEAMHAEVDGAVVPATLVGGLPARAARRRRARLAAVAVAASIAVVAAVVSQAGTGPASVAPTGLPTAAPTASESPEPPVTPAPRFEAASLPPGFVYWTTELTETNPQSSEVWPRAVTYARGFSYDGKPRTPIQVTTFFDVFGEIDRDDFPDARTAWVRIGDRRVVRVVAPSGTVGYHWTEQARVNVSVTAGRGVSDAELRHVVANVRLVIPKPSTSRLARLKWEDGFGVLLPETRGRGSRTIGPIAVPAEFDVHTACDGGDLRIETGALSEITVGCDDPDSPTTQVIDRTNGVRMVTITLTADASTEWAILVTTSAGHP